jgi:hypothetical protein
VTRQELRNELIAFRFNTNQATSINAWINLAYQQLWCLEAWPWRRVAPIAVGAASGAIGTVAPPADMHRPLQLFDENGVPLEWLTQKDFANLYQQNTSTGTPVHWTAYTNATNSQIYLGPGPATTRSYKLTYLRRISRLVAGTTDTAGVMSDDADVPAFPSEYHYLLVFGAMSLGLRLENDPTYPAVEETWQMGMQLMKSDLMPADQAENIQFGRLDWN